MNLASLNAAAHDLQHSADVLRQALADGTVPPTTEGLIGQLDHLESRLRSPQAPPTSTERAE